MRLDKFLSDNGIASRKDVRRLIKSGLVMVNGKLAGDCGQIVDTQNDVVLYNGERVTGGFCYLMMNKPQGVLSATEDRSAATVIDLLDERLRKLRLFPAGRLDKDSEGFLLLTNDGDFTHKLISPSSGIFKTYYLRCKGIIREDAPELFEAGLRDSAGKAFLPAQLFIKESSGAESSAVIRIMEGKFHQVKKMMSIIGNELIYLKRTAIGGLELDEALESGHYRELSKQELVSISGIFEDK